LIHHVCGALKGEKVVLAEGMKGDIAQRHKLSPFTFFAHQRLGLTNDRERVHADAGVELAE
jgi:hypothetical protein